MNTKQYRDTLERIERLEGLIDIKSLTSLLAKFDQSLEHLEDRIRMLENEAQTNKVPEVIEGLPKPEDLDQDPSFEYQAQGVAGVGWFNVFNSNDEAMSDKSLRKEEAEALASDLNNSHTTQIEGADAA